MSASKKSNIWRYFAIDEENDIKAKCLLCNAKISRGGTGKSATVTAMVNHIKFKHFNEHIEFLKLQKQDQEVKLLKEKGEKPKEAVKQKQLSIQESFETAKKFDINHPKAQAIHKVIAEMIAIDNEPLSVVQKAGFRRVVGTLQPKYTMPSRTYFTETIIPDIFRRCKEAISSKLSNNYKKVSFTTDIWSCQYTKESYISFTAHFISNDFFLIHHALNVKYFPGSHSASTIGNMLESLLCEWNLDKNDVHLFVSDNAFNMIKALRDSEFQNAACFNHSLQLTINDAITAQRALNDAITIAKKIVGHFNHSSLAYYNLKKIQEELQLPIKRLKQDIPTRWNSTFYLLERLSEQKRAISLYCVDVESKLVNLNQNQWNLIENCVSVLKPFEEVTQKMSYADSIISEVIPTVNMLLHYLKKKSESPGGLGTMIESLKKNLEERFKDLENDINYKLATILDPRFKCAFFSETVDGEKVILDQLTHKSGAVGNEEAEVAEKQSETEDVPPAKKIRKEESHSSLWESYHEIVNKVSAESAPEVIDDEVIIKNEIKLYLGSRLVDKDKDPIEWWRLNRKVYPRLCDLAAVFLSAPATSTYSERVFSEAGNVYTDKRASLKPDTAECLVFLHHNLLKLNFQY